MDEAAIPDPITALNDRFIEVVHEAGAPMVGILDTVGRLEVPLQAAWSDIPGCVPQHRRDAGLAFSPSEIDVAYLFFVHYPSGPSEGYRLDVITDYGAAPDSGRGVTAPELAAHAMVWYLRMLASAGGNVTGLDRWRATAAVRAHHPSADIEVLPTGPEAADMKWTCRFTEDEYEALFANRASYVLDAVTRALPDATYRMKARCGTLIVREEHLGSEPREREGKELPSDVRERLRSLHAEMSKVAWEAAQRRS